MTSSKLKVVFLVGGSDSASLRQSIEAICRLRDIEPSGVLIDHEEVVIERRGFNPVSKVLEWVSSATTTLVNRAGVSGKTVDAVLRQAFPDECFSLAELGKKYKLKIRSVGSLNSAKAHRALRECAADLGIAIDTRPLEGRIHALPRLGCIRLQKGKGIQSGDKEGALRELFCGATSSKVIVRFVGKDDAVVSAGSVAIHPMETPDSLEEKLHEEGAQVLARAVCAIRDGIASAELGQVSEMETISTAKRSGRPHPNLENWRRSSAGITILRNMYVLLAYYSGLYFLVRAWHGLSRSRGAIVLYHRVNDYSKDVLTVDRRTFAAQLLAISLRYPQTSTVELVERILTKKPLKPTTIAIHFDDCYQDILTCGAPIMKALGITGCAFINSGYIDTKRDFPHDLEYPFHYPMLSTADVQLWSNLGLEVGAHTVNHIDLGTSSVYAAQEELIRCREELEKIVGKPVEFFAFPFGRPKNIREETRRLIPAAGYKANFSANGGYIDSETDPYEIPRGGAHYESSPIYCLLQIEGLTLSRLARKLKSRRSSASQVAMQP